MNILLAHAAAHVHVHNETLLAIGAVVAVALLAASIAVRLFRKQ